MDDLEHERTMRELWQRHHLEIHALGSQTLAKANEVLDDRLHAMNELREQINAERGTFLRFDIYNKEHEALRETMDTRLKLLENKSSNWDGRVLVITGIVMIMINLIGYFLRH